MTMKLAAFTVRLATDAKFLREWNIGLSEKEREQNRMDIMSKAGLTPEEQQAVLKHDNEYINKVLNQGVPLSLGSWTNSVNSIVRINTL